MLKAKGLDEGLAAEAAQRLENQAVTGEVLIGVTAQELIRDSGMKFGPATLLVKQLQATGGSAPPAASGLQAGRDLLAELVRDMMGFDGFVGFAFRVRPESHRIPSSLSCPHTAFSVCSWCLHGRPGLNSCV